MLETLLLAPSMLQGTLLLAPSMLRTLLLGRRVLPQTLHLASLLVRQAIRGRPRVLLGVPNSGLEQVGNPAIRGWTRMVRGAMVRPMWRLPPLELKCIQAGLRNNI